MTNVVQLEIATGAEIAVPLNKLKKSPRNARKTPHGEAAIEALAASIQAKGMLQNLVVEPEIKEGAPTGCYFVTAGEGRRLAQRLRAKRKQIKTSEPIRCYVDADNDAGELSLDENVTRTPMHPADQFERFRELAERKGWGAEEIGARFGVSAQIVRQRMRLGAVSPKLMAIYRNGDLTLDQLMAFAITEDHAWQEQVFDNLSYNKEPWIIRRDLTASNVPATDRRAIFVGTEAYAEAGGVLIRDLFTEDGGGYFEDAGLLDTLVIEKLREIAGAVRDTEGWKWAEAHIDFPHAHGLRRVYAATVALPDADEARLEAASAEYDALAEGYDSYDDMPEDVAAKLEALDQEIDALTAKRSAFDPALVARAGVFVVLNHDGEVRIERGFLRREDEVEEVSEPDTDCAGRGQPDPQGGAARDGGAEDDEDGKPISDALIRDLTAQRTLGLRLALGEQPSIALIAVTHTLAAQLFYRGEASCLDLRVTSEPLETHAEGIADGEAGAALAARHDQWAAQLPQDVADLWSVLVAMDADSRDMLLAHCVAMTVDAVKRPYERKLRAAAMADTLAGAVNLDMTAYWTPTARAYFGRVTKAKIAEAVREAVSAEAADRIAPMKKGDMAAAAEQLVAGSGWLPDLLRTPEPEGEGDPAYAVAAE